MVHGHFTTSRKRVRDEANCLRRTASALVQ
jgi:hypothetical protein